MTRFPAILLLLSLFSHQHVTASGFIRTALVPPRTAVDTESPATTAGRLVTPRGGGTRIRTCADTDSMIAVKAGASAALEAGALVGTIAGSKALSDKLSFLPSVSGLPVLQWLALFFVIFSPSTLKSWIDGGMSVATKQAMQPNVVPGDGAWYSNLKKPWFNPPGWVFPIMWLLISKPTQFWAVSRLIKTTSPTPYWPELTVYCAHLALGDTWNEVFFGCQRVGLGALVISTFFGALLTTTILFREVDPIVGALMLPTCAWVFVASCLNWSIYRLNRK